MKKEILDVELGWLPLLRKSMSHKEKTAVRRIEKTRISVWKTSVKNR